MSHHDIPDRFFNILPVPIAIAKPSDGEPNYPIVFVNNAFIDVLGWTISDIPYRDKWWQKAYPDENYSRAVQRQWDLALSYAAETGEGYVSIDVNIMSKYEVEKRFKVFTQIDKNLLPGYVVVVFDQIPLVNSFL